MRIIEDIRRDVFRGVRRLLRTPTFTLAVVLTLALVVGANSAIFTLVHRVVLNPLPYPNSDSVIELGHSALGSNRAGDLSMSLGLYYHYLDRARTLQRIALFDTDEGTLTGGEQEPARINLTRATTTLASVLGVAPEFGRWFSEEEGAPGAQQVGVLSYGLWMRRFGGDRGILGKSVTLDGVPTVVVGVMPPSFAFPEPDVDAWMPLQVTRTMMFGDWSYKGVARLRDGRTPADARNELTGLIAGLPSLYPDDPAAVSLAERLKVVSAARTLKEALVGDVQTALWALLASAGVVLLIGWVNVANLFLVRWETRQREVAVCRALGAPDGRIARLFLAESALVSVTGGLVGLGLAWAAVNALVATAPANLPRLAEIRLDGTVVTFAFVLSLVAAVAFGSMPLWRRGSSMAAALHEGGRSNTVSRRGHAARRLLMGGQVALALVLLFASGLVIKSFDRLLAIDPGFNPESTLTFALGLPEREYPDVRAGVAAHHAILDRLSAIPGVTHVSATTRLPLTVGRNYSSPMQVEGRVQPEGRIAPNVGLRAVADGYFETMGIRILRGRGIARADIDRGDTVAVVNQAFVSAYLQDQDPIGVRVARGPQLNSDWLTIVGVVANTAYTTRSDATAASARPELYLPMSVSGPSTTPGRLPNGPGLGMMNYVVRSATSPFGLLPAVRRDIGTVDSNLAIAEISTLQARLERASAPMAFTMVLLVIAAAVALAIGVIGIYGVVSYIVNQRTNEIGVRLALGAMPAHVVGLIVRQTGVVVLAGIVVGLVASVAGSRLLESLLYDVSPRDPGVLALTALTLLAVAGFACGLPALRAAQVNPVESLRGD